VLAHHLFLGFNDRRRDLKVICVGVHSLWQLVQDGPVPIQEAQDLVVGKGRLELVFEVPQVPLQQRCSKVHSQEAHNQGEGTVRMRTGKVWQQLQGQVGQLPASIYKGGCLSL
jgi:hypothetical protein